MISFKKNKTDVFPRKIEKPIEIIEENRYFTEVPLIQPQETGLSDNYDNLLARFLGSEVNDNDENAFFSRLNENTKEKSPFLPVQTTKFLKEGLTGLLSEINQEEEKNNKSSIAREIFSLNNNNNNNNNINNIDPTNSNVINNSGNSEDLGGSNIRKKPGVSQQETLIENFMNLMNNAISSINQAIVKNIEKTHGDVIKKQEIIQNQSETNSENDDYQPPIINNYPMPYYNNPNNFDMMPMGFNQAVMPINPNNFLENLTFSSDASSKKSRPLTNSNSELLFKDNSHSEGQINNNNNENTNEDLWISDVFQNNHKENENNKDLELSEGEIRMP